MPKKRLKLISKSTSPSKAQLLAVVLVALFGIATLVITKAGIATVHFQPEAGQRSGGATVANMGSASGGAAIKFGKLDNPTPSGEKCTMSLHGAGGGGGSYGPTEGVQALAPQAKDPANGNNTNFWLYDGPHNGQYDPGNSQDEQYYQYLVNYLKQNLDSRGCGPTVIAGSSNGGGLVAKMYCRGEDFGDRVWAYYMDDPVQDQGVLNCNPSSNIRIAFFSHSTELTTEAANTPNFRCSQGRWYWYCDNDTTMTLATYQQRTGQPSLHAYTDHYRGDGSHKLYGDRYDALPWRFPAELWRTCFNNGNCSRQAFLP